MPERMPLGTPTTTILIEAKTLMQDALRLLDEAGASADIGAHLDLAICRLDQEIHRA